MPMKARISEWWPLPTVGPVEISFFVSCLMLGVFFKEVFQSGQKFYFKKEHWILTVFILHTIFSFSIIVMGFRPTLEFLGDRLYSNMPHYFLAIMVLLVIKKNDWTIKNYEKVADILIIIALIWAAESILAFYLGISIPKLDSTRAAFGENYFSSGLTNSLHIVSKASIVASWLSVYMFFKYRSKRYLFFTLLFFAVILSTLNRASIASLILFGSYFAYLALIKFSEKIPKKQSQSFFKKTISVIAIIPLFATGSYFISNKSLLTRNDTVITTGQVARAILNAEVSTEELVGASSLLTDVHAYVERLFQYSRAVEVIIQYPLGNGAGIGYNVCYSKDAIPIFTDRLRRIEPFLTISKYYQTGIFGADMQQYKVGMSPAFSIHNVVLNWLLDFGIFAWVLLLVYLKYLIKLYKFSNYLVKSKLYFEARLSFILLFSQLSVFLAMQATAKFQAYWLLVFLYCFSIALFKSLIRNVES